MEPGITATFSSARNRSQNSSEKETRGLPEEFLRSHYESCLRIPMRPTLRSLNLSNSVAITVYEALRQLDFPGMQDYGIMKETDQTGGISHELQ